MAYDYIDKVSYRDEATNTTTTYEIQATSSSNATTADKLSCGSVGSSSVPVYFQSSGIPNECSRLSLDTTGNAATATKLATARTIRTNLASTSTASFDGSANITPGVTGTLPVGNGGTGNTSGNAASADKLNTNAGSSTQPVYFSNGVPVAGIKFTYSGGVLNITT